MSYEVTMFFRQFWIDPRLAWSEHKNGTVYNRADGQYNVAADMLDLIWQPDSYFIDEIGRESVDLRIQWIFELTF